MRIAYEMPLIRNNQVNIKSSGPDVVNELLESCILAYPTSSFIISLYKQYMQRGLLSKKQLQGLLAKANRISDISSGKLATLEATIKKMPNRYKSEKPIFSAPKPSQDFLDTMAILQVFPQHKGALELHEKLKEGRILTPAEKANMQRFLALTKKQ